MKVAAFRSCLGRTVSGRTTFWTRWLDRDPWYGPSGLRSSSRHRRTVGRAEPDDTSRSVEPRARFLGSPPVGSSPLSGRSCGQRSGTWLIDRKDRQRRGGFFHEGLQQTMTVKLRDPEKLALSNYLLFCEPGAETAELAELLTSDPLLPLCATKFFQLRRLGSEANHHTHLWDRWQNLVVGSATSTTGGSDQALRSKSLR